MIAALLVTFAVMQVPDSGRAYSGLDRAIAVPIPRLEATVTVDGVLDEAAWAGAARLTGFSQYQPVDSRPAEEATEVLVWYGPTAIHFGIRAREAHGDVVRATRADRDNIGADDHVQILLDTYDDRRLAYLFGVNPFGVQQDGIRSDQFGGGAGGFSAGGRSFSGSILDGNVDLNPDFVFESRGRLVPGGYEVEIRIPFKSLRYQGLAVETWGINVLRRVQHTGYQDSWAPVVRANASFLGQSGRLEGLHDMRRGLVAEVTPTATASATGAPDTGGYAYGSAAEFGLTGRLGLLPNLTLDGTINPDFSQVEADVGQVTINERFELFYPEKRPFFLEGLELFDTPNQLIYTRRIADPDLGVKLAGKLGGTSVALLTAADADASAAAGSQRELDAALRLRRDIGRNSTAGIVATSWDSAGSSSRLLGADLRLVHSRLYFVEIQAVQSWSDSGGGGLSGPLLEATWDRTGRSWGFNYRVTGVAPDFNAAVGFVNRTGVVGTSAFNRLTLYGRRGALVETASGFFGIQRTYDYGSFLSSGAIEGAESATFAATLRGGWSVRPSVSRSFVSFAPSSYADYGIESPVFPPCCAPFTVPPPLRGLTAVSLAVTTPTFRRFTAAAGVSAGAAAIFPEASEGRTLAMSASVDWRPAGQVRVSAELARRSIDRERDGSRFSSETIPRIKVEYQATRAIFLRLVSQYAARRRDALVDRDGVPIYIGGQPAAAAASNDLRMDWLFSYRPSPGTLVYLGYGSSLAEPSAFAFGRNLRRVQDGFFGKVSWLFRR